MRTVAILVAGLVVLGLAAAPAHAETKVLVDGPTAGIAPQHDVLRARIANRKRAVVVTVRFRDLRRGAPVYTNVALMWSRDGDGRFVSAVRRDGTRRAVLVEPDSDEFTGDPVPCAGLRARWSNRRNTIRFRVPHTCLEPTARRLRVKVVAGFWSHTSRGDYTRFLGVRRG